MTEVRTARPDDCDAAVRLLDAAMLEVEPDRLRERIEAGSVLVADEGGDVVGVCVLESVEGETRGETAGGTETEGETATEMTQIAVRRSRRARGIGRELVEAAVARVDGPLTATFRPQVRPFYESLGFEIRETEGESGGGEGGDGENGADGEDGHGDGADGGSDARGRLRGVLR